LLTPCIEYDRNSNPNPTGCDFFDEAPVPAGRQPFHEITVLEQPGGALPGDLALLGKFVLNNSDTVEQTLNSLTLSVDHPELFSSITVDYGVQTADPKNVHAQSTVNIP